MGDVGIYNAYMTLSGAYDADVTRDERMARRTTCRIGGPAALFCHAHSLQALRKVLAVLAHEHVEWVILGKGSNILVSDGGYDGCVIELGREFSRISFGDDGIVTVGRPFPCPGSCVRRSRMSLRAWSSALVSRGRWAVPSR